MTPRRRLHLMSRGLKASSINPIVGALRFFYGTTLGNKQLAEQIPFGRVERRTRPPEGLLFPGTLRRE